MTEKKSAAANAAQAKAEAMRKAEAAKARTKNMIIAGVAIVAVVAAIVLGAWIWNKNKPEDIATGEGGKPNNVSAEGFVTIGKDDAPVTVSLYSDFMCPFCKQFEDKAMPVLQKYVDSGDVKIEYYSVAYLNRFSRNTKYSTRAAGAALCVANDKPEKFTDYVKALFDNQPAENTKGLTNDRMAEIGNEIGGPSNLGDCISQNTFEGFVDEYSEKTGEVANSTPTLIIGGEKVAWSKKGDDGQVAANEEAIKEAIDKAKG